MRVGITSALVSARGRHERSGWQAPEQRAQHQQSHCGAFWTLKAIKTCCQFERRQLESFDTLSTALALFAPVAWKLLLARSVAHSSPNCEPTAILSPLQVKYLEKRYKKRIQTARDALLAMARLGGHLSQNGEPGWQTLGRGYEKLATGEAFYRVLKEQDL